MFGFGCLFYELLTRMRLFPEVDKKKLIDDTKTMNVKFCSNLKSAPKRIIYGCIEPNPSKRITFDEIIEELQKLYEKEKLKKSK